ncbi:MAG: nuclear transport factor 2 family protein [Verrucomicrobiota bacterium]
MKNPPPQLLLDFFAAANAGRINDAAACFGPDALVHDENNDHQGSVAIRAWIEDTTLKYRPSVEVHEIEAADDGFAATGIVSGNFPGSPVPLHYSFTVRAAKIIHLTIS